MTSKAVTTLSVVAVIFLLGSLQATGSLRLSVRSEKQSYVLYEPIVVNYTIQNQGDAAERVPSLLGPGEGWVQFEIAKDKERFLPYVTGPQGTTEFSEAMLKPGQSMSSRVVILTSSLGKFAKENPARFQGSRPFPCDSPGAYRIRVRLILELGESGPRKSIESDAIVVTVVPPSESERNAMADFPNLEDYAASVGGDYTVSDVASALSRWEQFIARHGSSVYTPYVQRHLADLYLHGTGLPQPDSVRAVEL